MILPQGADLLVKTTESSHWYSGLWVLLSLFFWSYMLWYSGRMISYCKEKLFRKSSRLMFHIPRLLGFSVYSIFISGLLISTADRDQFDTTSLLGILLMGIPLQYVTLHLLLKELSNRIYFYFGQKGVNYTFRITALCGALLIASVIPGTYHAYWLMLVTLSLQICFLLLVMIRKEISETRIPLCWKYRLQRLLNRLFRSFRQRIPEREEHAFLVLQLLAFISFITFVLTITIQSFAVALGSITVLMLAFGFYTGLCNLVWVFAYVHRINIVFFLFLLALGGAQLHNVHRVETVPVKGLDYSLRPDFKTYIYSWLAHHEEALRNPDQPVVPMIFVHSDGGASRSGYWVAGVLSRLDSLSETQFSQHLFALSGASGGSLGNTTYYSLLYLRQLQHIPALHTEAEAAVFLNHDFLSFSLARMMGADPVNYIYPILPDRARALEQSMEAAGTEQSVLHGFFARPFSTLWIDTASRTLLPILCINTTRMQDAQPAVISNVLLSRLAFGKRLDVLSLLPPEEDIRISTAVVLGARFPYISPAGSIAQQAQARLEEHYFVDGGYFDNSGAGVVHEMILEIEELFRHDDYLKAHYGMSLQKIRYQVLHISNSPRSTPKLKRINTMVNDLAAPFITLVGSYNAQTAVNDFRLQAYVTALQQYQRSMPLYPAYQEINLYLNDSLAAKEYYSMNWVLSDATIQRMTKRLHTHSDIQQFAHYLKLHTLPYTKLLMTQTHKQP
ncbi:hypothetical protein [Edaphocola aurantiacus]|uniref:hypothetical protein n=1 Tax=Edaphocola aurantiacus TaxID=2601682 RepID=UPI001C946473|nr:hypothetical protein [Edaphocola aurantiacus]